MRDTGAGIPPSVRARIFDPFFTTKPVGRGHRAGAVDLPAASSSALGGEISVDSELGKGSTFRVTLPPARPRTPAAARGAERPSAPARGGRLLVVDDEPLILRRAAPRILGASTR